MRNAAVVCAGLLTLMLPVAAQAQSANQSTAQSGWMPAGGHVFITFNALGQAGGDDVIDQARSVDVYDESGMTSASQRVEKAAGLVDFGGGYRTGSFGVGLSFTASKNTNAAEVSGSIPHPIFFDRPRTVATSVDGMEHKERVVHLQAYYFVPVAEKMDVGVFVGPSFYTVKQDYVTGLGAFTESSNFATVTLPVGRATAKKSPVGFNIGAEGTYSITPNVAGAILLRYSRATADLDLGGQEFKMKVGDFQIGGGVRLRF